MPKSILREVSENVTLYHRSRYPMKVGDIIKAKRDEDGKHWLEDLPSEIGLEYYRREKYPDKPSRFTSVYSSVIPRSRFVHKGTLYVVKPRGKIHVANSAIIDEFHENFDRRNSNYEEMRKMAKEEPEELRYYINQFDADNYWKGGGKKANKEDIEVLSDSAIITEIIDESNVRLQENQAYEVTQDDTLFFWFQLYTATYGKPTEREMGIFNRLKDYLFSSVDPEKRMSPTEVMGYLKKGLLIMPTKVVSNTIKFPDDVHSGVREHNGKYREIQIAFYLGRKWYRSYQDKLGGMNFSLHSKAFLKSYHKQPWDYGKYLKKV